VTIVLSAGQGIYCGSFEQQLKQEHVAPSRARKAPQQCSGNIQIDRAGKQGYEEASSVFNPHNS
jgi:hypothetical protein